MIFSPILNSNSHKLLLGRLLLAARPKQLWLGIQQMLETPTIGTLYIFRRRSVGLFEHTPFMPPYQSVGY